MWVKSSNVTRERIRQIEAKASANSATQAEANHCVILYRGLKCPGDILTRAQKLKEGRSGDL